MSGSNLGVYCPSGGDFYICQHGVTQQFLGCCTSNPCLRSAGSCPPQDLRALSFNATTYDQIKPQTCFNGLPADWYACSQTSPPFLGCCLSNACSTATGCPQVDLKPASLLDTEDSSLFATTATSITAAASSIFETSIAAPSTSTCRPRPAKDPGCWSSNRDTILHITISLVLRAEASLLLKTSFSLPPPLPLTPFLFTGLS
ncbi:hypothetical protein F5883DRAFT_438670 [Diaporthe sp. PMI_573]|nr:hypothetical protein F5883DRAFT_438670 [Diaporthaceae sp. PMI_573]